MYIFARFVRTYIVCVRALNVIYAHFTLFYRMVLSLSLYVMLYDFQAVLSICQSTFLLFIMLIQVYCLLLLLCCCLLLLLLIFPFRSEQAVCVSIVRGEKGNVRSCCIVLLYTAHIWLYCTYSLSVLYANCQWKYLLFPILYFNVIRT